MQHFMMDGFRGFRSRFDDMRLVHELLEEIPQKLGCTPAMPPMLLPYYNGVEPDDCGISAFVLLAGGHFTLHTFSFRECFFADFLYPEHFDTREARYLLESGLPVKSVNAHVVDRRRIEGDPFPKIPIDEDNDFGPHLCLDLDGYRGPTTFDALFDLFDGMPPRIGMTPIMRPYLLRGRDALGRPVLSALTMIAESHIALHVWPEDGRAFFDIFSCRFFDQSVVVPALRGMFPAERARQTLIARGSLYRARRTERPVELSRSRAWLDALGTTDNE